ncbi:MAG: FeoA family protein [Neisseria sp.]|nr:FeoA family protein [Neisseria sp.]
MFRPHFNRVLLSKTAPHRFVSTFDKGFYMLDLDSDVRKVCAARYGDAASCQTLCSLKPGKRCRVRHIGSSGVMRRRLMDLGLVPDAEITLLRAAPLNDPIEIRVGNAFVSLRRAEAEKIEVVAL